MVKTPSDIAQFFEIVIEGGPADFGVGVGIVVRLEINEVAGKAPGF